MPYSSKGKKKAPKMRSDPGFFGKDTSHSRTNPLNVSPAELSPINASSTVIRVLPRSEESNPANRLLTPPVILMADAPRSPKVLPVEIEHEVSYENNSIGMPQFIWKEREVKKEAPNTQEENQTNGTAEKSSGCICC